MLKLSIKGVDVYEVVNRFNEVLGDLKGRSDRCGVGILRNEQCSLSCVERKRRKERYFSFDKHEGFSKVSCLRCGGEHYVKDCPTSCKNIPGGKFATGVCGRCGFYRFEEGHGVRLGESVSLFRHDLRAEQSLEKGWREADNCGSGLCDLLYPCLFYLYKTEKGKSSTLI
jgi:hypothetical protein